MSGAKASLPLPVWTLAETTYRYAFGHWRMLARLAWLPIAVAGAFAFVVNEEVHSLQARLAGLDPRTDGIAYAEAAALTNIYQGLNALVSLIAMALVSAALLRALQRGDIARGPAPVRLGADEARLFVTFAAVAIIIVAVYAISGLAIAALAKALPSDFIPLSLIPLLLISGVLIVWIVARMSLVAPASIARKRIGVGPGWEVTRGHALRLLGFWFVALAPFITIGLTRYFAAQFMRGAGLDDFAESVFVRAGLAAMDYVIFLASYGVMAAASAVAYRNLTGDPLPSEE